MSAALLHLRVYESKPFYTASNKALAGGGPVRGGARYWKRFGKKDTRLASSACGHWFRFDETARFNTARLTCAECRVLSDLMNEVGFSKPLTPRRLAKLKKLVRGASADSVALLGYAS